MNLIEISPTDDMTDVRRGRSNTGSQEIITHNLQTYLCIISDTSKTPQNVIFIAFSAVFFPLTSSAITHDFSMFATNHSTRSTANLQSVCHFACFLIVSGSSYHGDYTMSSLFLVFFGGDRGCGILWEQMEPTRN